MIEKLLENWLDNASERSYQPVFVQMLSAQGYHVVHSTRHQILEYGKDILAVDPDGVGCAYQLKGNPGGSLGLRQFRDEVQPQLVQMMSQAIVFPGFPDGPHRSYLVSNGFFEEEVQRAIDDMNRGPYLSKVKLITRGDLLSWCKDYGTELWPCELNDDRLILELFLSDYRDILPTSKLSQLIGKVLSLEISDSKSLKKSEFQRVVSSAALLTGIAISGFAENENHFAVASAWGLFAINIIAGCGKHGFELNGAVLETFHLAETAIGDALEQLWNEVKERQHLVEGNAITDPEIYSWRYILLLGLLSCLAWLDETTPRLTEDTKKDLQRWLLQHHKNVSLWGEGAIANLVPWLVYLRKHDSTLRPDYEIASLTETVIFKNQRKSPAPLVNPYYGFKEIARLQMKIEMSEESISLSKESFNDNTYTSESLFHLLVRTNLKQKCIILWPNFTKLAHRTCLPDNAWEYCTLHINNGIDETKFYQSTYSWADLKKEALQCIDGIIPNQLFARPWLLALWWQVAPYRYTTAASKAFVNNVFPEWGKW